MKIEAGKKYRMRNGDVTGPLIAYNDGAGFWSGTEVEGYTPIWEPDGTSGFFPDRDESRDAQWDLVEEVIE